MLLSLMSADANSTYCSKVTQRYIMFNVLLLTSCQFFVFFLKKEDVLMSELIICGWSGILVREK